MARVSPTGLVLDTNCWIYYLDDPESQRARWLDSSVFRPAAEGHLALLTSTVCLAELLVGPHRAGGARQAAAVRRAVEALPGSSLVAVTGDIAEAAAGLRARTGLRLPDALVQATAMSTGARLLTNDRALAGTGVLVLDDVIGGPLPPPPDGR